MINICKKMADDNSTCDSTAAVAQIALFTMYVNCKKAFISTTLCPEKKMPVYLCL